MPVREDHLHEVTGVQRGKFSGLVVGEPDIGQAAAPALVHLPLMKKSVRAEEVIQDIVDSVPVPV